MKSLCELTAKIREWNSMGLSLLPTIQIAIIHNSSFNLEIIQLLNALSCRQPFYTQRCQGRQTYENSKDDKRKKTQHSMSSGVIQGAVYKGEDSVKVLGEESVKQRDQPQQGVGYGHKWEQDQSQQGKEQTLEWEHKLRDLTYAIYITSQKVQARVHLIIDQQVQGQIVDQNLKNAKNVIQRLKRNKSLIFLNFNTSIHKLGLMSEHIQLFGLGTKTKERQIKADCLTLDSKAGNNCLSLNSKARNNSQSKKNQTRPKTYKPKQLRSLQQYKPKTNKEPQLDSLVKSKLNGMFKFGQLDLSQVLINQVQKKYASLFGVQINRNYNQMKRFHKQVVAELKRYNKIQKIMNQNNDTDPLNNARQNQPIEFKRQKDLTSYALNCLYQAKQYLISSLMGTFSNVKIQNSNFSYKDKDKIYKQSNHNQKRRSIHWEIMEIMNEIWDIEGDALMKQIDKMPISYIKQRYKMLDYQTIGGFMPSSCFQSIFSPSLRNTLNQILQTLQIIQLKILKTIKLAIQYFFDKTNICYDFSDQQLEQFGNLCYRFRKETQKVLKSQIQFISTSSQDFWSFKQVKSSLYGPDQQIYIQIKYIGKNYVKKVFDNIRQTLPRLVGQNLLKEIVLHLQTESLNSLTKILQQVPLEIQIRKGELGYLQERKIQEKKTDKLIYFFSLRTNSQTSIKNLHQKMERNWNRTYKRRNIDKICSLQVEQKQDQKQGFVAWARNLIKRNNKRQTKRSLSQERKQYSLDKGQQNQRGQGKQRGQGASREHKRQNVLSQKNWLLIINTDKQVQVEKISRSSQQGFPERLRPAIWLYLAKKQMPFKFVKIQDLLNKYHQFSLQQRKQLDQTYIQIEKDVLRTPPPQLFAKGYLKQSITKVLRAYAIYDKELRYTQGMNFIVGIILCVLSHYGENCEYLQQNMKSRSYFQQLQQRCLIIFVYMMQRKGLRKIMLIQRATITDLCIRLEEYIRERSPVMIQKIQRSGFGVQVIFSGALISGLTTSEISFGLQKRVIDLVITHQFSLLYKIIGQFTASAEPLCHNMQNQNLYFFLKGKFYNQVYNQLGDEGLAKMFHSL